MRPNESLEPNAQKVNNFTLKGLTEARKGLNIQLITPWRLESKNLRGLPERLASWS